MLILSRAALVLYLLSLAAALLQFGYVFVATDLLAVNAWASTIMLPALTLSVAILQLLLALHAYRRRWIG